MTLDYPDQNLTLAERNILWVLKKHTGERNAITYKTLADRLNVSDRDLRETVADMIVKKHLPIGTSSHHGYYLLEEKDECIHCGKEAWSRSTKLRERARAYIEIKKIYFDEFEQPELFKEIV
jgi:hypothetical protein